MDYELNLMKGITLLDTCFENQAIHVHAGQAVTGTMNTTSPRFIYLYIGKNGYKSILPERIRYLNYTMAGLPL